jgi:hypothetical protein
MYIVNAGFLSVRDPRQSAMRVRTVDGHAPELRVAD